MKNDGTVWSCGQGFYGQLGINLYGTFPPRLKPVKVFVVTDIIAIAAGNATSLFLKNDGTVWGCGENYGTIGDGTNVQRTVPIQSLVSDITTISTGESHSLFLKNDGTVWATGYNYNGQLGDGTTTNTNVPFQLSGLSDITSIAAGRSHSLFLQSNESVWACGINSAGELGDGTTTDKHSPVEVLSGTECESLGLEEMNNRFSVLGIYPNPANNSITIKSKVLNSKASVKIFNAVGKEVFQSALNAWDNDQSTIDISSLSSGVYFIRLVDGENQRQAKFVKE